MTTANIYLTFNGNCREVFEFYQKVFGGEFPYVGTFADMPAQEGMPPIPDEFKNRIMHMSLPISKETALMGSDVIPGMGDDMVIGTNFSVSISTDSKEEADRIFAGISEGGQVTMPMDSTFWGDYFGMCTDQFGINWMIGFQEAQ